MDKPCPNCGRCPHCGHVPSINPWVRPWGFYPQYPAYVQTGDQTPRVTYQ